VFRGQRRQLGHRKEEEVVSEGRGQLRRRQHRRQEGGRLGRHVQRDRLREGPSLVLRRRHLAHGLDRPKRSTLQLNILVSLQ